VTIVPFIKIFLPEKLVNAIQEEAKQSSQTLGDVIQKALQDRFLPDVVKNDDSP
jgi:hypothetical protein